MRTTAKSSAAGPARSDWRSWLLPSTAALSTSGVESEDGLSKQNHTDHVYSGPQRGQCQTGSKASTSVSSDRHVQDCYEGDHAEQGSVGRADVHQPGSRQSSSGLQYSSPAHNVLRNKETQRISRIMLARQ